MKKIPVTPRLIRTVEERFKSKTLAQVKREQRLLRFPKRLNKKANLKISSQLIDLK